MQLDKDVWKKNSKTTSENIKYRGGAYENIQIKYLGLVVLNAEDLVELGRVEFELPGPVPKPLHGCFLPTWDYSPVI